MTAVRFGESAKYGARLYGYLLGVILLGGTFVVLGGALAWPEIRAWIGSGRADPTIVAAGSLLLFLGITVLSIGSLGVAYKLIADAVRVGGGPASSGETAESAADDGSSTGEDGSVGGDEGAESGPTRAPGIDPGPVTAAEGASAGGDRDGTPAAERVDGVAERDEHEPPRPENPPEPSPAEIVFGTSDEGDSMASDHEGGGSESSAAHDEATDTGADDTTSDSSGGTVKPAARDAPSDPLADPTEDE